MANRKLVQAFIVSGIFFLIQLILVQYHEMWADEIHAWEIVKCSHSFGELLYNTRYEGHPQLWFVILFGLQKLGLGYFSMQVVHVFIAALAVFVFCFFSPFSLLQNILFCAGYFFSYEYSIISRNYSIEMVLLFLCAGIYTKYNGRHLVLLSILFFLLFQTNVFAIIIGVPFYIYIVWNIWDKKKFNGLILPAVIILVAITVAAITAIPPADSAFSAWSTKPDVSHFIGVLSDGFTTYFPIPKFTLHYWNTNLLDYLPHHQFIEALLSLIIFSVAVVLFKNDKKLLFLFCFGTFGELVFIYIKYNGYIRHHGHIFILFVLCYWLYCNRYSTIGDRLSRIINRYFITAILVVQVTASCFANMLDVKYVFSNDMPAAQYIKAEGLDKIPMLGDGDFSVAGIAGILDEDVYFMRPSKWGKYILPDQNWGPFIQFSEKNLLSEVSKIQKEKKKDIVVILNYPFNDYKALHWSFLKAFGNSVIGEDFYLYKVNYILQDAEFFNASAEAMIAKNEYGDAIKLLERAILMNPDYGLAYMNLADCYNNGLNDYTKALSNIDSAMKYAPQNGKVIFDKGAILYNAGRKSEAQDFFKSDLKLAPRNISAYLALSQCYGDRKDYNDALIYLYDALKIDPDNKDVKSLVNKYQKAKR